MRPVGLTLLTLSLLAAAGLARHLATSPTPPPVRDDDGSISDDDSTARVPLLIGCACRRETVDSNESSVLWRCLSTSCSPCACDYAWVSYEVHPPGKAAGACDALCTDTEGCTPTHYYYDGGLLARGPSRSYALAAPIADVGDEVAAFGFLLGPDTDNKHLAAARAVDPWFAEVGGVRLRLFSLENDRIQRNGETLTSRIPVGYETTAGDGAEGVVEWVRPLEATDRTGKTPALVTVEGYYRIGVRRLPESPVETYLVHTANPLPEAL